MDGATIFLDYLVNQRGVRRQHMRDETIEDAALLYRARALSSLASKRLKTSAAASLRKQGERSIAEGAQAVRTQGERALQEEMTRFTTDVSGVLDPSGRHRRRGKRSPYGREHDDDNEVVHHEDKERVQRRFIPLKLVITICLLSLTLPSVVTLLSKGQIDLDHPARTFALRVFEAIVSWASQSWWLGVALIVIAVLSKVPPFVAITPGLIAVQRATRWIGLSFPMSMPIPLVPPSVNLAFWGVFFLVSARSAEELARATTFGLQAADPSDGWEWWAPWPLTTLGVTDIAPKPLVLPVLLSVLALTNLVG